MRLPAYPRYKPSGVGWLGDVPEHWQAKRLKGIATYLVSNVDKVAAEDEMPVRLCNYTDVYYNDHIRPSMGLMETTATPEEIRRFGLKVGDVVITKDSEEWSDIAVPALVVESAPDLVCGYHLAIVRPRESELLGRFLLRVLQACAVNQQFQVAATGVTRYGLPKSSIGEAWLPLPLPPEQHAIADFLDRETAKIDTLVAKKRTLIARLKEKRVALISHTVTRGLPPDAARAADLNPHPKLKPSGIEWLGEVPEHWNIWKVTHAFRRIGSGTTPKSDDADCYDGNVSWVTTSELRECVIMDTSAKITDAAIRNYPTLRLYPKGTLLFAMYGATIGRLGILGIPATVNQACAAFADPLHLDTIFTYYWLQMRRPTLIVLSAGGGQPNLSQDDLRQIRIPAPSLEEQHVIVKFLDRETTKIDQMVAKVETAIERLQEYRTALITAAVTGKIDVRGTRELEGSARGAESERIQA